MGLLAFPLFLLGAQNNDISHCALAGFLMKVDQNGHSRGQFAQIHPLSADALDAHILLYGKDFAILTAKRVDVQNLLFDIHRLNLPGESLLLIARR